jgi:uncharacterized protein (DUF362 family)
MIIYDLHSSDLEETEFILKVLKTHSFAKETIFVLISSVVTWAKTVVNREKVKHHHLLIVFYLGSIKNSSSVKKEKKILSKKLRMKEKLQKVTMWSVLCLLYCRALIG